MATNIKTVLRTGSACLVWATLVWAGIGCAEGPDEKTTVGQLEQPDGFPERWCIVTKEVNGLRTGKWVECDASNRR